MLSSALKYIMIGSTSLALMSGCASNSAAVYDSGQSQKAQTVQLGTVVSVHDVKIQNDSDLLTAAGAVAGGLAGSQVSHGTESALAALAGAVIGGYGTNAIQKSMAQKGYEITVKLDSSHATISIVQKADVLIEPGMRVRVISGAGKDRVLPL